jgi:hypothetical protein
MDLFDRPPLATGRSTQHEVHEGTKNTTLRMVADQKTP